MACRWEDTDDYRKVRDIVKNRIVIAVQVYFEQSLRHGCSFDVDSMLLALAMERKQLARLENILKTMKQDGPK